MRVLVTGVYGYIGSVLAPILMARNVDVVGLDTGYYRDGWLYSDDFQLAVSPQTVNKDLRRITEADLAGLDAVVHLAELSNDPLGENSPEVTHKINHGGSVTLADLARRAGVSRFVYASSCSVYGAATEEFVSETAEPNPQTAYARCKVLVERDVGALATRDFCPVFLRNATAYGASPRMRFDVVLNDLSGLAWTTGRIAMTSDGSPWRPVVHIRDICEAIYQALIAPSEAVRGQIFNVGANEENYRVRELAEIVASVFPGCELSVGQATSDTRSYRVSFDKIREYLPSFRPSYNAKRGIQELRALFERIQMPREIFEFRAFTRLKQLRYLQETRQIDVDFFWTVIKEKAGSA